MDYIIIDIPTDTITVELGTDTVVIELGTDVIIVDTATDQVTVSVENAGTPGGIGATGPRGSTFRAQSFSGAAAGQTVTLAGAVGDFAQLVVNGLVEDNANFTLDGVTLTLPPGLVWNGAACVFRYSNL